MRTSPPLTRGQRIRKLLVEFLVIVIGVFVALAAETWWSEREERAFERELRVDMIAEFHANLRILEADLADNEESARMMDAMAGLDEAALQAVPDDEMTARFRDSPSWSGFDPEMGIAQALVESGNLNVIDDRELRLLLSRWAGLLEEKRRFNLQAVDVQLDILEPKLAEFAADLRWTPEERRHAQTLYQQMAILHGYVIENQTRLREAARAVLAHIEDKG